MHRPDLVVVSASRRTDLPRWYPEAMVRLLRTRYRPERVHTLVVWTKFPHCLLAGELRQVLDGYAHLFAHVTITGLGGTALEPRAPGADEALAALPGLVAYLGHPARLRLRIDPIVVLRRGEERFSSLGLFSKIAAAGARAGVTDVTTSIMEPYPKVVRRLARAGWSVPRLPPEERVEMMDFVRSLCSTLGLRLHTCCVPGEPSSGCINGSLLSSLHPGGIAAPREKATGQRPSCTCTRSVDIGWYGAHPCRTGCLYCYANPVV